MAAGDDGPSRSFPTDRPPRTILRPAEVPAVTPATAARRSGKEAILLVATFCVLPASLIVFLGPPLLSLL